MPKDTETIPQGENYAIVVGNAVAFRSMTVDAEWHGLSAIAWRRRKAIPYDSVSEHRRRRQVSNKHVVVRETLSA